MAEDFGDAGVLGEDGAGGVRRDQHVLHVPERGFLGQRFHAGHVQRGEADLAGGAGFDQRILIHHGAAGDVDEDHARTHGGEGGGIDQVHGGIGVGDRDHHGIGLGEGLVHLGGGEHGIEQVVVGAGAGGVAGNGGDVHVEGAGEAGAAAGEVAGADDDQAAAGHFRTAGADPAMGLLLGLEMGEAAPVGEQGHEGEFGERAGVHAAGGGDEDVAFGEAHGLHVLADAGAGGLDPFQLGEQRQFFRGREVPQDVGFGEHFLPALLLQMGAGEAVDALVVGGVAGGGQEGGVVEHLQRGMRLADRGDVLGFEGGGDHDGMGHGAF